MRSVCRQCLLIAVAAIPLVFPCASSAGDYVLARGGRAKAVIVVGKDANPFHHWVAGELQRYLQELTGGQFSVVDQLPITDEVQARTTLIVLGGPNVNPLTAAAQKQGLVDFTGLQPDGFILKAVELAGRRVILVGGNDETGTMYAAYDLLERLGIVFQITNDIIPQRKSDLTLPSLDARIEPALKYRGMHCWQPYRWYMGLDDFRKHIDQLAKLKLNYLQFYLATNSVWIEFAYGGKVADVASFKDSGYIAFDFPSIPVQTGTRKDVRIGQECFPRERVCAPEFAAVQTPQEARAVAREFLREIIRYAHQRKVQVCLTLGELPYVPPNLAPPTAYGDQYYCGTPVPYGDPALLDIWEAAGRSLIETYPEADAYGIFTSEHHLPVSDAPTQQLLKQHAAVREQIPSPEELQQQGYTGPSSPEDLEGDQAMVVVTASLIERLKKHHPQARLGVLLMWRPYLLRPLDKLLPKDVWLANMENYNNSKPLMHFYGDITGRDLLSMPDIDNDGGELHVQFNATLYDRDEIIPGSVQYGLAGVVGQMCKERGDECNARYIAEGLWNPQIQCRPFYESYLRRLYGDEALEPLLKAFLMLEENEQIMGYQSRGITFPGFWKFAPGNLRPNAPREYDIAAGRDFTDVAAQYRKALDLLRQGRPKVLPGAQAELDYVIFKTESYISYLEVLDACSEVKAAYDQALLAESNKDNAGMLKHLTACQAALDQADRLSAELARTMVAYGSVPTERHILFRFNQNVIGTIEGNRKFLAEAMASHKEKQPQEPEKISK